MTSGSHVTTPHLPPGPSGRAGEVRLRNLIALSVAALLGFLLGLLEAVERLTPGPTLRAAAIGLAVTVLVGLIAAARAHAPAGERIALSLLRAGLAGAVFTFVFEGMRLFFKIGEISAAVAWWAAAGVLALVLLKLLRPGPTG